MTIQTSSIEIDGNKYEITQLGARDGRRMLVRLTNILGPALGNLIKDGGGSSDGVAHAIMSLSSHISEDDVDYVCKTFGKHTEWRNGSQTITLDDDQQDLHFAGRYDSMVRWISECLRINFSPFFDMLRNVSGKDIVPKRMRRKAST